MATFLKAMKMETYVPPSIDLPYVEPYNAFSPTETLGRDMNNIPFYPYDPTQPPVPAPENDIAHPKVRTNAGFALRRFPPSLTGKVDTKEQPIFGFGEYALSLVEMNYILALRPGFSFSQLDDNIKFFGIQLHSPTKSSTANPVLMTETLRSYSDMLDDSESVTLEALTINGQVNFKNWSIVHLEPHMAYGVMLLRVNVNSVVYKTGLNTEYVPTDPSSMGMGKNLLTLQAEEEEDEYNTKFRWQLIPCALPIEFKENDIHAYMKLTGLEHRLKRNDIIEYKFIEIARPKNHYDSRGELIYNDYYKASSAQMITGMIPTWH